MTNQYESNGLDKLWVTGCSPTPGIGKTISREDFTKTDEFYEVIINVPGKSSFSGSIKSLKHGGPMYWAIQAFQG